MGTEDCYLRRIIGSNIHDSRGNGLVCPGRFDVSIAGARIVLQVKQVAGFNDLDFIAALQQDVPAAHGIGGVFRLKRRVLCQIDKLDFDFRIVLREFFNGLGSLQIILVGAAKRILCGKDVDVHILFHRFQIFDGFIA